MRSGKERHKSNIRLRPINIDASRTCGKRCQKTEHEKHNMRKGHRKPLMSRGERGAHGAGRGAKMRPKWR